GGHAVPPSPADVPVLSGPPDSLPYTTPARRVADADPATITAEELGTAMTGAARGHLEATDNPSAAADGDTTEDEAR
ncbi:heme ABC transporter ATP-binding protein, partial [Streptomyces goshikiensis]